MQPFEWHPIRERDSDGTLTSAGVQWLEQRRFAFHAHVIVASTALIASCLALFLHLAIPAHVGGGIPALFFILFAGAAISNRLMPGAVRALIFHADGKTSAPFGFAHYNSRFREMSRPNTDIVSIEARGNGTDDASVIVYMRCGQVVYVAGKLHRDQAHRVAVQLTLALAELREAIARNGLGAGRAPSAQQRRPQAVID